jgi:hypothetical protein
LTKQVYQMKTKIWPALMLATLVVVSPALVSAIEEEAQTKPDLKSRIELRREEVRLRQEALLRDNELRRLEMEARREAMERQAETRRAQTETRGEERRSAAETRRTEFRREVAKRQADNTARVLRATVTRLETIIARIESRIVKAKAEGLDTAEAELAVALAKEKLTNATISIQALTDLDLSGENAEEVFKKVRSLAKEAKDHLRDTREALVSATKLLKSPDSN